MVAATAPAEQVGTVPHILRAPSTLTLELELRLRRERSIFGGLGGLALGAVAADLAEVELVVETVVTALAHVRLGGMDVLSELTSCRRVATSAASVECLSRMSVKQDSSRFSCSQWGRSLSIQQ